VRERRLETEESSDLPSLRNMYDVVMELVNKMSHMEDKIKELTTLLGQKEKKVNMVDWLNTQHVLNKYEVVPFEKLIGLIKVERKHLEFLFKNDYTSAIMMVLKECISGENSTIRSFVQKPNMLFVYANDSSKANEANASSVQWMIMPDNLIQQLIHIVEKLLLCDFVKWQKENSDKMEQDDFAVKYATNVKKIIGGNLTRDQLCSRVKSEIYKITTF